MIWEDSYSFICCCLLVYQVDFSLVAQLWKGVTFMHNYIMLLSLLHYFISSHFGTSFLWGGLSNHYLQRRRCEWIKHSHPAQSVCLCIGCSEQPSSRLLQWRLSHADLERVGVCVCVCVCARIHACIGEQKSSDQCRKRRSWAIGPVLHFLNSHGIPASGIGEKDGRWTRRRRDSFLPLAWWNRNSLRTVTLPAAHFILMSRNVTARFCWCPLSGQSCVAYNPSLSNHHSWNFVCWHWAFKIDTTSKYGSRFGIFLLKKTTTTFPWPEEAGAKLTIPLLFLRRLVVCSGSWDVCREDPLCGGRERQHSHAALHVLQLYRHQETLLQLAVQWQRHHAKGQSPGHAHVQPGPLGCLTTRLVFSGVWVSDTVGGGGAGCENIPPTCGVCGQ